MEHGHALHGFAVLVVEDNGQVLEATAYLIEAAFGCKVLTASSCVEALALIDEGSRFDLLFSDVVLPGKDGLTLARMARERLPSLQVVLATGWQDEIESIVERGHVALLKPYSVEQLEAVFTELLCKPTPVLPPSVLDGDARHLLIDRLQSTGGRKPWPANPK